ncbi:MAG: hypothetical protein P0Y53_02560 [Candidatus Pseudobacter hemicellulosilyticus]|uniref:Uncharacterized protein n=1 Tax=Candidatus Pseudobacter hemicellulosilyticus TaxID=3121375 RepID=A0AAJ5WQL8_9BACT|nr:MAG: hypothetical protein P0Y53_02560 [Pseudobacter sp.]
MKLFLILVVATFLVACNNVENKETAKSEESGNDTLNKISAISKNWNWPDSLDAVAAAPASHLIVHEDSAVRILQVICPPGDEERIHTHRYRSTIWFTQSAHFIFYNYAVDANNHLVKKDSFEVNGFPEEVLNKGQMVDPEHPHSIKNIGTDTFMAYRIEYKKEFKE